jgi:hypothetical protein
MLTIRQLLGYTPRSVKQNASYCRTVEEKKVARRGNPVYLGRILSTHKAGGVKKIPPPPPEQHRVVIEGLMGEGTKVSDRYVKVSCDCGFFWSHCEVALNKKGAADIKFSNGKPPVEKNPAMIPLVCKHLVHALTRVFNRRY